MAIDRINTECKAAPPRLRLKLQTIDDVRAEMARLYREGKAGTRDVGEVSKLANVLALLGRMIEGSDIEKRLAELELQAETQAARAKKW